MQPQSEPAARGRGKRPLFKRKASAQVAAVGPDGEGLRRRRVPSASVFLESYGDGRPEGHQQFAHLYPDAHEHPALSRGGGRRGHHGRGRVHHRVLRPADRSVRRRQCASLQSAHQSRGIYHQPGAVVHRQGGNGFLRRGAERDRNGCRRAAREAGPGRADGRAG